MPTAIYLFQPQSGLAGVGTPRPGDSIKVYYSIIGPASFSTVPGNGGTGSYKNVTGNKSGIILDS